MLLSMILTSSIFTLYIKTEHAKATALTWAMIIAIIILVAKGITLDLIIVPIIYLIGWGFFSLATYLEESIFFKTHNINIWSNLTICFFCWRLKTLIEVAT